MQALLEGKVALVTGAAVGIGRGIALALARHGATVVASDIDTDKGLATLEEIKRAGSGDADFHRCDVSDEAQVRNLFAQIQDKRKRLDCAANNAGVGCKPGRPLGAPFTDFTTEDFDFITGVNIRGTWLCMREEIRLMAPAGGGAIVNMSSVLGQAAMAGTSVYAATKHAIIGLTKTAAIELAQAGVRVNAISAGAIATPLVENFVGTSKEAQAPLAALHPMNRLGQPLEVGEAAAWLLSPAASYVTGIALPVDGGYLAQ